jgi:peptidoglycan hydrolase-like protein with peptidoglycan-binding domain
MMQEALGIGADGAFGPGTERALKSWQEANGLTVDGIAGPMTLNMLFE